MAVNIQTPFGPRRNRPPWRVAVLCESRTPFWTQEQAAQAAMETLSQAGCLARIITPRKSDPSGKAFLRALRQRGIDGAIVLQFPWVIPNNLTVPAWQFPVVFCHGLPLRVEADAVTTDEVDMTRKMLDHLWGVGYRRCGYLITLDMHHARKRLEVFKKESQQKGMWDETLILDLRSQTAGTPWSSLELNRIPAVKRFFASRPKPLAMWSHNDFVSAALVEWLLEQGYRVPADVAVAGVDNHLLYALANIPLTTVSIPCGDLGHQCARLLLDRLRTNRVGPCRQFLLPPALLVRQSTVQSKTAGDWLNVVLSVVQKQFVRGDLTGIIRQHLRWRQDVFAQRFHKAMGCTFLQYRDRLRLEHAARLLLNDSSAKIQTIAQAVGFSSPGRFAYLFCRKFGINPAQYRARFRPLDRQKPGSN